MSISLMTAAWRIENMPPTQKLVLLSLADNANDQGECYPSVPQIARRTCLSVRAVRDAIRGLEESGMVRSVCRSGTSTVYFLNLNDADQPPQHPGSRRRQPRQEMPPRHQMPPRQELPGTPAGAAAPPRQELPGTPAGAAAKPSLNRQMNRHLTINRPADVPERVWADFLAVRSAKRSPLTATALAGIEREARKAGMSLSDALALCCERGWQGFRADWAQQPAARASPPPRRSAAVEAGLALAGYTRNTEPETIDVLATELAAPRLG